MKLIGSLGALLLIVSVAQGQDTRGTALKLPPARTPAVADAAQRGDVATVRRLISERADVSCEGKPWDAEKLGDIMATEIFETRHRGMIFGPVK